MTTAIQRPAGLLWWLCTGSLALSSLVVNVTLSAATFGVPLLVAFVAGTAQSAALMLLLIRPIAATALQFLAVAVFAVFIPADSSATWPLTVPGMIVLVLHIGLITLRTPWRTAVATWWASSLLLVLAVLLDPRSRSVLHAVPMLILYPANSALVLVGALGVRHWAAIRRQLAEARRDVAAEQSQRAVVEERTRIARELHDVVAHSMSVIHMQATSASYRIKDLDPAAEVEFAQIAAGARAAMREMRQLLAVLRDEGAEAELAPVPDLSRLAELADSARRAGLPVELGVEELAPLSEAVALAAYRIVQESLSNVIRHAPGARTKIGLVIEGGDLVVRVGNDAAVQPAQPMEAPGRAGLGLAGMRERVRLAGGTLVTGPRAEGGYLVVARLPVGGAA